LAEALLVFVGILAAFALESWWADRGTRALERSYVEGLQDDFEIAEAEVTRLLERHRTAEARFTELDRLLRSGEGLQQPDSVIALSHTLWSAWVYSPQLSTYENLLATTGIGVLESERLRQALVDYGSAVDYNNQWDRFLIAFDQDRMLAMLAPRVPYFAEVFGDSDSGGPKPDVVGLAADMEFRNLIAIRASGERVLIERRTQLLKAIQEVRQIVDEELRD
jgi:hypothetical protein